MRAAASGAGPGRWAGAGMRMRLGVSARDAGAGACGHWRRASAGAGQEQALEQARRKSGHWSGAIQATQAARPRVGGPSGGWRPGAHRRSYGGKLLHGMRERGDRIEDAAKVFDEMLAAGKVKPSL
jgi:hypothetical protein